jgi:AbrB family looped-hinge helix DNA binding protein
MAGKVWRHRITRAGQVSIPAEVRERWGSSNVLIVDEGARIVLRPVPDDPIEAIRGAVQAMGKVDVDATEAVRRARTDDNAASERKWREHRGG